MLCIFITIQTASIETINPDSDSHDKQLTLSFLTRLITVQTQQPKRHVSNSLHPCRPSSSSLCVVPRKPAELKDLAPGTNPPFLLYNGTLKTDFIKIEEFLEQTLAPPRYILIITQIPARCDFDGSFPLNNFAPFLLFLCRYPHLSPLNKESFDVGADIFAKFSAYIKNSPNNACKFGAEEIFRAIVPFMCINSEVLCYAIHPHPRPLNNNVQYTSRCTGTLGEYFQLDSSLAGKFAD